MGRVRMSTVSDLSGDSLTESVQTHSEPGSAVHTDGWVGYQPLSRKGYEHRVTVLNEGKSKSKAEIAAKVQDVFGHVHQVMSLVKRWVLGTHQGAVSAKHLQSYLDEYVFRFNRRSARHHTWLFQSLVTLAAARRALPYWKIVGRDDRDTPLPVGVT